MNPFNNRPYKSRILAQPFGSRRAPANWDRVATFIQFVALKLLCLAVGALVEDVYCAGNIQLLNLSSGRSNSIASISVLTHRERRTRHLLPTYPRLSRRFPSCATLFGRKLVDIGFLSCGATLLMRYSSTALRQPPRASYAAALASSPPS